MYDNAYRAVETIRRSDAGAGLASNAPARSTDLETDTAYNKDGKIVEVTVKDKDATGAEADRSTYTFYDDRERPTVSALDMNGDGVGADPATTYVDDASAFAAQSEDLVTRTAYDGAGHAVAVTDPRDNTVRTVYDGAGRAVEKIMPAVSIYLPDGGGLIGNYAPTTHTVFDAASNVVLATDANGNQTKFFYDARNRQVMSILDLDGDGAFNVAQGPGAPDIVTLTAYDLAGNKYYTVDPNGNLADMRYDRANRPTLVTGPAVADAEHGGAMTRPQTTTQYDKDGHVISVTDPRNVVTTTSYDELGRPRFVTQNATAAVGAADRLVSETRYDANGNKLAVVLDNWVSGVETPQVTTYGYDAFDRQITETLPSVGDGQARRTTTAYDEAGDVLDTTDPMGQQTQADYDRAGRATEVRLIEANGTVQETRDATYDADGNVLTRSDLNGITTDTYDALSRLGSETRDTTAAGIADAYTIRDWYDADGNRTRVQYPGTGRVLVSRYDRASRMLQMNDQPAGQSDQLTNFAYDANGNRTRESLPNGVAQTSTFDALNRLTDLHSANAASSVIYDITYAYNLASQRVSAVEKLIGQPERDTTWSYDGLYRLTGESWTGPQAQGDTYAYDPAGNRLSQTLDSTASGGSVVSTAYTYDDLNELLTATQTGGSAPGTTAYGYDLNGNRTSKAGPTVTTTYKFDVADRLVEADQGGAAIFTAAYDAATQRLSTIGNGQTTLFRYDGGQNFQEVQGGSVVTELIRAGGLGGGIGSVLYTDKSMDATPGPVESFTYDALGNTVALTDQSGTPTQTTLYNAFGTAIVQTGASTNDRLHNTKEHDASTGLDNYGMRYYDASTGTFISRDPSGYSDGLGVYQSVHDDPVNSVDPQGLLGVPQWVKNAVTIATPYVKAGATDLLDLGVNAGVGFLEANTVPSFLPASSRPPAPKTAPGAIGRNLGHAIAVVQGIDEIGGGASADAGGVALAIPTFGGSLLVEIPGTAVIVHGGLVVGNTIGYGVVPIAGGSAIGSVMATTTSGPTPPLGSGSTSSTGAAAGNVTPAQGTAPDATDSPKEITIDASKYPESAQHLEDAGATNRPLPVNRAAAAQNRADALNGQPTVPGMDRDEAPPAVLRNPGDPASVRPISPGDNRGAGGSIGRQLQGVPDGGKVTIKTTQGDGS